MKKNKNISICVSFFWGVCLCGSQEMNGQQILGGKPASGIDPFLANASIPYPNSILQSYMAGTNIATQSSTLKLNIGWVDRPYDNVPAKNIVYNAINWNGSAACFTASLNIVPLPFASNNANYTQVPGSRLTSNYPNNIGGGISFPFSLQTNPYFALFASASQITYGGPRPPPSATIHVLQIRNTVAVDAVFTYTWDTHGGVIGLQNNAGQGYPFIIRANPIASLFAAPIGTTPAYTLPPPTAKENGSPYSTTPFTVNAMQFTSAYSQPCGEISIYGAGFQSGYPFLTGGVIKGTCFMLSPESQVVSGTTSPTTDSLATWMLQPYDIIVVTSIDAAQGNTITYPAPNVSYPLIYNPGTQSAIPYVAQQPYLLDTIALQQLAFVTIEPPSWVSGIPTPLGYPLHASLEIIFKVSWVTDLFF